MGELGSGSGSSYPSTLDTDNIKEVNDPSASRTKARAEVPNDLAAAVIAMETELGTDPAGTRADVKTFLQADHGTNGMHQYATVAKTANYTASLTDHIILCTGTFTITLPTAVGLTGKTYLVKNVSTGTVTVDGNSTETIDQELTRDLLNKNSWIEVLSDGANWVITNLQGFVF